MSWKDRARKIAEEEEAARLVDEDKKEKERLSLFNLLDSLNVSQKLLEIRNEIWGEGEVLRWIPGENLDWYDREEQFDNFNSRWRSLSKYNWLTKKNIRSDQDPTPPSGVCAAYVLSLSWPHYSLGRDQGPDWGSIDPSLEWRKEKFSAVIAAQTKPDTYSLSLLTEYHHYLDSMSQYGIVEPIIFRTEKNVEERIDRLLAKDCKTRAENKDHRLPYTNRVREDIKDLSRALQTDSSLASDLQGDRLARLHYFLDKYSKK